MRIAALVHFATPWRNAGSETVLHLMLRSLVEAGHEVQCFVTDCPGRRPEVYEGVRLTPVRNPAVGLVETRKFKPDVVMSHHQNAATSLRYLPRLGIRTVYLTHNDMDINELPLRLQPDLVVHNSHWVEQSLSRFRKPKAQIVIHPPLDCDRHRVDNIGSAVTLINHNEHKGGKIFFDLAARMHDVRFIAVTGGHGIQVKAPALQNLTVVRHSPDLKPVWAQTKLLLMPSIYESYGLVGIEAGCSGIPTLANSTPGLRESLGESGLFVLERENLNEWEVAIRELLADGRAYDAASVASRKNSQELCDQTDRDLIRFVSEIENLSAPVPV